jgi:hypothetical protein
MYVCVMVASCAGSHLIPSVFIAGLRRRTEETADKLNPPTNAKQSASSLSNHKAAVGVFAYACDNESYMIYRIGMSCVHTLMCNQRD